MKWLLGAVAAYLLAAAAWVGWSGVERNPAGRVELLNVACDPTRGLWQEINQRFVERSGLPLTISMSHAGSATQAQAVTAGLQADVVTLALWLDTDAVARAGLISPNWEKRLPERSLPYYSTVVMVVRKGNPKGVRDWADLARPGVQSITPNPRTSGNGKWSFLALWGSVIARKGTEQEAEEFVRAVYRQIPVLDASARTSTLTFAQKRIGDVHITWENEARLEVAESAGDLEIVVPSLSVRAEPHVAWVDRVVDRKGTRAAAQQYLEYLYTDEAQDIIAKHHHRPSRPDAARRHAAEFPELRLFDALELAPSWGAIQERFFAEGALADRVLAAGGRR